MAIETLDGNLFTFAIPNELINIFLYFLIHSRCISSKENVFDTVTFYRFANELRDINPAQLLQLCRMVLRWTT